MTKFFVLMLSFLFFNSGIYGRQDSPNIIIFIADDISWDDFGAYGNTQVKTPHIDLLAANGLRFDNVFLTASSCSPSRNSILTGRYPHNTGAAELHTEPPLEMLSFAELLKGKGYYTASSGKFHMGEYARRGFNSVTENLKEIGDGGEEMWLSILQKRPKDKPFFMWYAALDAHRVWGPNEFEGTHQPENLTPPFYLAGGEATQEDLAKYYDEIYRFDKYIGKVIAELRLQDELENTLIIIMSDNGRPFPHSKTRVNDRGMKTPFIVHWPDKIQNKGISQSLISVIDIAPTILSIAGVNVSEQFQGHDFSALFSNPDQDFRNYVFAEHNWHDYEAHERMVRTKDHLYILNSRPHIPQSGPADAVESPSYIALDSLRNAGKLTVAQTDIFVTPRPYEELYNCQSDPLQLLNIASVPESQHKLQEMQHILQQWMEETGDNIPDNLTKDWYLREPGYLRTEFYGIRGEMPGAKSNAIKINKKGPM